MSQLAEFDRFAADYERELDRGLRFSGENKDYFAEQRVRWLAGSLRKLGRSPASVLDFGCGVGGSSLLLQEIIGARTYVGVDNSSDSIDRAKKLFGAPSRQFEVLGNSQAFRENVEVAYCNGVFHHIEIAERPAAAKYVYNSLCRGGIFSFWENNPWNPGTRYVMSRIEFDRNAKTLSAGEACRLLSDAGFTILSREFLFIFPRSMRHLRFFEPRLSGLPFGAQYQILCKRA
jgi:SAM-dependent methyltransferase